MAEGNLPVAATTNFSLFREVQLFATDFDGVHTDGFVTVDQYGNESVRCSRRDGLGISMLKRAGIKVCVFSKERSSVVAMRCEKLGVPFYQNVGTGIGKLEHLMAVAAEHRFSFTQVLYIGDDLNDLNCLSWAGLAVVVRDCHPKLLGLIKNKSPRSYRTSACGGQHAVREVCELVLDAKGIAIEC